jgi:hypothetical protein
MLFRSGQPVARDATIPRDAKEAHMSRSTGV